jgi:hypothetical protein
VGWRLLPQLSKEKARLLHEKQQAGDSGDAKHLQRSHANIEKVEQKVSELQYVGDVKRC